MAIGDRILDIFGQGGNRKFYMRDFKNAARFQPGVDPVRQNFQGYVNFILNRDLFSTLFGNPSGENEFRTTISSLVKTAQMPGVQFKTETLNEYNRKKIVNTGVEYDPISMTVYDTVGNEWLTLLMKYFSYHYMNPRNKNAPDTRDVAGQINRFGGFENVGSAFGTDLFNSNAAGYNPNESVHFFERIDYVLYHGNKGVQYSIINPALTGFRATDINYGSSDAKEFELSFAYESFTVYNKINFGLSDEDLDRFENVADLIGPAFAQADLPIAMGSFTDDEGVELRVLGDSTNKRERSSQLSVAEISPSMVDPRQNELPVTYSGNTILASGTAQDEERSFLEDLILDTADNALRAAINNQNIGDAALGSVLGATSTFIGESINTAIKNSAPNQGDGGV